MDQYKHSNYSHLTVDEVFAQLHSSLNGLSAAEGRKRLQQHGYNRLHRHTVRPAAAAWLHQLPNLFVLLLVLGAALSLCSQDGKTAGLFLILAAINAGINYIRQPKTSRILDAVVQLPPAEATVLRNGKQRTVPTSELVLGDVVLLEAGSVVPADVRLVEEAQLMVEESALTARPQPIRKFVHALSASVVASERHNVAYMGTSITSGSATGVVIGVGLHTKLGRIINLCQSAPMQRSPLQHALNRLAVPLACLVVVLAVLLIVVALLAGFDLKTVAVFGMSLCAAVVPGAFAAQAAITLAATAHRLAKSQTPVTHLPALEALAVADVILTDTTAMLTKNELAARQVLIGKKAYAVSANDTLQDAGKPLAKAKLKDLSLFFSAVAATSRAIPGGVESALLTLVSGGQPDAALSGIARPEIAEFPFDASRQMASSIRQIDGQTFIFTLGAAASILERSKELWDHGHVRKLTKTDRTFFADYSKKQAQSALQSWGLAYRILPAKTDATALTIDDAEKDFTLLGMVTLEDSLRSDIPAALQAAASAHVMVASFNSAAPTIAAARAQQLQTHLGRNESCTHITSEELSHLTDDQITDLLTSNGTVFLSLSAEDKLRLIEVAKRHGLVVAITGNGLDMAPALAWADVAVTPGAAQSNQPAGIALAGNGLAALVHASTVARVAWQNICHILRCVLTDNASKLLLVLVSVAGMAILHIPAAITVVQILAIDFVAQLFPVAALGWDKDAGKASRSLKSERPGTLRSSIFSHTFLHESVLFGLLAAVLAYGNFVFYFVRHGLGPAYIDTSSSLYMHATILTYLTIVLCQFINLLLVRSDTHKQFFIGALPSNKKLLLAFGLSFFCIANIIYNPAIQSFFGAGPLSFGDWLTAVLAAALYLGVRLVQLHTRKHTRHAVLKLHQEIHGPNSPARI